MTHNLTTKQYKGCTQTKWGWQAQMRAKGRFIYLGLFNTPELAARAYDEAAKKHHGIKAKLNFSGRLITVRQEQIYRLCSSDFYNLKQKAAAVLMGVSEATICNELKRVEKKCPSLFPLYKPMSVALQKSYHYETWMDSKVICKF